MTIKHNTCNICGNITESLGFVPFDKNAVNLPIVDNTSIEYVRCTKCYSISCPTMLQWTPEDLNTKIYNEDYLKYDPEYGGTRAYNNSTFLLELFKFKKKQFSHLDYGSGQGDLSTYLLSRGWDSTSYDPYSNNIKSTNTFDFITAFEVFEHSLNIDSTIKEIKALLNRDGVILFTTLFADKYTTIDWWYILPRNGHISIVSESGMKILAKQNNLFIHSISESIHILSPTRNSFKNLLEGRTIW